MIYEPKTGALYADDGEYLKTVHCPMALRVNDLASLPTGSPDRYCHECKTDIHCIDDVADDGMREMLRKDPNLCVFATAKAKNIVILKPVGLPVENEDGARVIRTARSYQAMKDASARGNRLLVIRSSVDPGIGSKFILYQNKNTGRVHLQSLMSRPLDHEDEFGADSNPEDWNCLGSASDRLDAPYPFAAYVIPPDLKAGERVFIEDIADDRARETIGTATERLQATYARWNGVELQLEPSPFLADFIG